MKLLDKFCNWYMGRKKKTAQVEQKKIQDKKLEEAGDKLKSLYEFVRFINEKCLRNRHERKSFWRNVSEGQPLVEDTIINVLRRMGVKEESIKAIEAEKVKALKQREEAEFAQKAYRDLQRKASGLPFIVNGICSNEGDCICNLGYACDGCPYNKDNKATKKQVVKPENKDA